MDCNIIIKDDSVEIGGESTWVTYFMENHRFGEGRGEPEPVVSLDLLMEIIKAQNLGYKINVYNDSAWTKIDGRVVKGDK